MPPTTLNDLPIELLDHIFHFYGLDTQPFTVTTSKYQTIARLSRRLNSYVVQRYYQHALGVPDPSKKFYCTVDDGRIHELGFSLARSSSIHGRTSALLRMLPLALDVKEIEVFECSWGKFTGDTYTMDEALKRCRRVVRGLENLKRVGKIKLELPGICCAVNGPGLQIGQRADPSGKAKIAKAKAPKALEAYAKQAQEWRNAVGGLLNTCLERECERMTLYASGPGRILPSYWYDSLFIPLDEWTSRWSSSARQWKETSVDVGQVVLLPETVERIKLNHLGLIGPLLPNLISSGFFNSLCLATSLTSLSIQHTHTSGPLLGWAFGHLSTIPSLQTSLQRLEIGAESGPDSMPPEPLVKFLFGLQGLTHLTLVGSCLPSTDKLLLPKSQTLAKTLKAVRLHQDWFTALWPDRFDPHSLRNVAIVPTRVASLWNQPIFSDVFHQLHRHEALANQLESVTLDLSHFSYTRLFCEEAYTRESFRRDIHDPIRSLLRIYDGYRGITEVVLPIQVARESREETLHDQTIWWFFGKWTSLQCVRFVERVRVTQLWNEIDVRFWGWGPWDGGRSKTQNQEHRIRAMLENAKTWCLQLRKVVVREIEYDIIRTD